MITRIISLVCGVLLVASSHLCQAGIEPVSIAGSALAASVSGNGISAASEMSPDGRFVVFSSLANNLATNDYNYYLDVFLRDRLSGITTLISANPDGFSGNGYSGSPSMSTNGAWIAFESNASDLTAGDTNRATDVFVRNTTLGLTALVSVNTNGTPGNRASSTPIITPDGRFVAFESAATDLVTNDIAINYVNVYIRDLASNTTVLASVSTNGLSGGDGASSLAAISADGRYALFLSAARNLGAIPAPINGSEVILRDMQTQCTYWVSTNVSQLLKIGNFIEHFNPVMSADGHSIAFRSKNGTQNLVSRHDLLSNTTFVISSNLYQSYISKGAYSGPSISQDGSVVAYMDVALEPGSDNRMIKQVYVWDAVSNTNTLATVASDGSTPGNADSINPVLSADGRTLAFLSMATNLDANTLTGGPARLFIRNLTTGVTKLASSETNPEKAPGDVAEDPSLSADGGLVAFSSFADGLVDNDNNGQEDVFVNNVQTGATELISSKSSTMESLTASASSFMAANGMSSDGRFIVFSTAANDLVAGDTNLQKDVYERDLVTGKVLLVSGNADGTGPGNGCSMRPSVSADGSLVAFQSTSTDLVTGDTNGTSDVFLRDMATGQTRLISTAYGGVGSAWGVSDCPVITPDGHFVIFRSNARNLTAVLYSSSIYDLYVYNTETGTSYQTSIVGGFGIPPILSISPKSQFAAYVEITDPLHNSLYVSDFFNHAAVLITNNIQTGILPAFSGDGRWLAYLKAVTATSNQVILRDLMAKTNTSFGVRTNVWKISLNGDGSRVAYSVGITPAPCNKRQIFVYDMISGSNILVSANISGVRAGNGDSRDPIISPDGRYVYFNSRATDLVADADVNGTTDVYVRDLTTGTTRLLSFNRFKTGSGNNLSVIKALSADGQVAAMESFASDLIPMDLNMTKDVFVLRVNETVEDFDNDGLPDSWELKYFGSLDRDGTGDFDNDGMSDGAEFLAGTDPADKQSALIVTEIGKPDATGRLITWAAVAGNSYKIQYKTHLNDAAWEELSGTIKAESAVVSKLDDTTNGSEQRFYRVMLVP
jgi:Tol biopolymer transport system component